MTLRDNYTPEKARAAQLLDLVAAGHAVPQHDILWALVVLGEPLQ
jgi:hypothetical protein